MNQHQAPSAPAFIRSVAQAFRGACYLVLYRARFTPKLLLAKSTGRNQRVRIAVDDLTYDMNVDVADGGLGEDVFLCSIREYPNVFFYKEYLLRNAAKIRTHVGIGSNIGYYAIIAAKTIGATAKTKVVAVEPVPDSFARLKDNLELNGLRNVTCLNVAVGEKDGAVDMIVAMRRNLSRISSVAHDSMTGNDRVRRVVMVRPGTLFKTNRIPGNGVLFRWDIEGYEYQLVMGNLDFFRRLKSAFIIMEFHPYYLGAGKTVEFLRTLKQLGFRLDQVVACEPLYFVTMPRPVRNLLIRLFLLQYGGRSLGKLSEYRSIDDLIAEYANPDSGLYHFPNLHLYLSK